MLAVVTEINLMRQKHELYNLFQLSLLNGNDHILIHSNQKYRVEVIKYKHTPENVNQLFYFISYKTITKNC